MFMNFLFHFLFNFSYAASTFFFEEDFRFNCVFVFMHWSMGMKWPLELMWFGFLDFLGRRVLPQSNIFLLIINLELLLFLLILFCSFKFSTLMSFQLTMWICSLSSFHHIAVRHYWVFHREENAPVKYAIWIIFTASCSCLAGANRASVEGGPQFKFNNLLGP